MGSNDEVSSDEVAVEAGPGEVEDSIVEVVIPEDVVTFVGILDSDAVLDTEDVVISKEVIELDAVII